MAMTYLETLHEEIRSRKNPADALKMAAYMKNKFPFAGLKSPILKDVMKNHVKTYGLPEMSIPEITKASWNYKEREMQYVGMFLVDKMKQTIREEDLDALEQTITNKSWWDTVDHIAKHHMGHYIQTYPHREKELVDKWIHSPNMWLKRTAILYQLGYKQETDTEILAYVIQQEKENKEFFIRKAIGWALREYAKTNPDFVVRFTDRTELQPLSRKEALKNLQLT
ncbi:DNA alkylation repair protein [Fictibacillus enclensis]|uniref:DNA alkylation repair protein n=1 Tax=Fictibacillus enclensis TaxID=1017270 RepID=UPI0025A219A8|nr:DNA alkylation repair protein [Fictibacillus enclensis]MDM5201287.1 DNA alkylation repair protein [Fictibacillus enclensis]